MSSYLKIAREIENRRGEGQTLSNLGEIYRLLGDVQRAIEYLELALKISREIGDRRGEGHTLGNLGIAYSALGDTQKAIDYSKQHLAIAREIGDRFGEGNVLGNLGAIYYDNVGDVQQATKFFEQALAIRREIGDITGVALVSLNMARLYAEAGETAKALSLAQEATGIFTKLGLTQNAQQAQNLIAQIQGGSIAPAPDPFPATFDAFLRAGSLQEMQALAAQYPLMREDDFINFLERFIPEKVPPEQKPVFQQRLDWLKEIAKG